MPNSSAPTLDELLEPFDRDSEPFDARRALKSLLSHMARKRNDRGVTREFVIHTLTRK